jgi:hypothetical protein
MLMSFANGEHVIAIEEYRGRLCHVSTNIYDHTGASGGSLTLSSSHFEPERTFAFHRSFARIAIRN